MNTCDSAIFFIDVETLGVFWVQTKQTDYVFNALLEVYLCVLLRKEEESKQEYDQRIKKAVSSRAEELNADSLDSL